MSQTATMRGKVCMITGGTSGIGKAVALGLARMGAHVVVVGRNPDKGASVVREIRQASGNNDVDLLLADFTSFASVRELAATARTRYPQLHVLDNNAYLFQAKRVVTADGLEYMFQVGYLSAFLLTNLLLDTLKAGGGRIINMAAPQTGASINFDDLMGEKSYSAFRQTSQTKLALILFAYELARRLAGTGVTVNALNPGLVNTHEGSGGYEGVAGIGYRLTKPFAKSPDEGARTPIYLATSPAVAGVSGKYFEKEAEKSSAKMTYDTALQTRLWQASIELTHLEVASVPA